MARLKSQDQRNAILTAAIDIFAEKGLSAPTLAISAKAGVAEGTIYTYFDSKDGLINVLYQELKRGMADAMMTDFPRRFGIQERLRHVWNGYVNWGIANPQSSHMSPSYALRMTLGFLLTMQPTSLNLSCDVSKTSALDSLTLQAPVPVIAMKQPQAVERINGTGLELAL